MMMKNSFLPNQPHAQQQERKVDEMTNVPTANVQPIFQEAIDLLDANIKREYSQALEIGPHLVATETSQDKFWRCEDNNPYAAARRLDLYWEFRWECHGPDR